MYITSTLTVLIIGFVLFELIEHVILPIVWSIRVRNQKSLCGVERMVGKKVTIKRWQKTDGFVLINGELWRAVSDNPLLTGDIAIIEKVEGLVLKVIPYKN